MPPRPNTRQVVQVSENTHRYMRQRSPRTSRKSLQNNNRRTPRKDDKVSTSLIPTRWTRLLGNLKSRKTSRATRRTPKTSTHKRIPQKMGKNPRNLPRIIYSLILIFFPQKSRLMNPNSSRISLSCSDEKTGPSLHTRYLPTQQLPQIPRPHFIILSRLAWIGVS